VTDLKVGAVLRNGRVYTDRSCGKDWNPVSCPGGGRRMTLEERQQLHAKVEKLMEEGQQDY
jgi:hypothetical protein